MSSPSSLLQTAVSDVERHVPVPCLLVLYGRFVAASFLGVDMDSDGVVDVFDAAESLDQRLDIVALLHIAVVETHGAEEVALCLTLCLTQQLEVTVETTMVLGDAHLVVVDSDDDVCTNLCRCVEAFESLAAGEGAVTDDRDDILFAALQVTAFLQTRCQGYRGRGMTDLEVVVLSILTRRGIAGDSIHVFYMEEAVGAAREHLVRIALMADAEDELVVRRVEDVVECDSSLGESEVRSA